MGNLASEVLRSYCYSKQKGAFSVSHYGAAEGFSLGGAFHFLANKKSEHTRDDQYIKLCSQMDKQMFDFTVLFDDFMICFEKFSFRSDTK